MVSLAGVARFAICVVLAIAPAGGTVRMPIKDAGAAFRRAFGPSVSPEDRRHLLERVAKEHLDSPWGDDALWALGEMARRRGETLRSVYLWQCLLARKGELRLEPFTRSLEMYRTSPVAQVAALMEAEGLIYVADGGRYTEGSGVFLNARRFDPTVMVTWDELGTAYERMNRPALALRAYRKALDAGPHRGRWAEIYRARIVRLERRSRSEDLRPGAGETSDGAGQAAAGLPTGMDRSDSGVGHLESD